MGKSFFLCLLALLLALSGCTAPAQEETQPAQAVPTETAPTEETQTEPPLPETTDAIAQIPQEQVWESEEDLYISWIGGSTVDLSIYKDIGLQGEPLHQVEARTQVEILNEMENCYLVEVDGVTGYIDRNLILPWDQLPPENSQSNSALETAPTETVPETTAPEWTPPKL